MISGGEISKNVIVSVNSDGTIESVEKSVSDIDSRSDVEFYNGVLIPGMVNCHSHLEYSYVKGMILPGAGLGVFIQSIIGIKTSGKTSEKDMVDTADYWDAVMAGEGVVAVGDHNNNDYVYGVKRKSKIEYINFIELFDVDGQTADQTFEDGLKRVEESRSYGFKSSVIPHANYTMSQDLIDLTGGVKISENGHKADGILSVHFKESIALGGSGELNAIYEGLSYDRDRSLLIHSIYATGDDIRFMKSKLKDKITVVMCPMSNIYIENRVADFDMLTKEGIMVALGTDSLSSNTKLSMVAEMECMQSQFPGLSLAEVVKLATENGAITLGIDSWAGTIEVGKRPGLVLLSGIDFDGMRLTKESKGKRII